MQRLSTYAFALLVLLALPTFSQNQRNAQGFVCNDLLVVAKRPVDPHIFARDTDEGENDQKLQKWFDTLPAAELRKRIVPLLQVPESRNALFRWVQRDFKRISALTVAKLKDQKPSEIAVIGTGFHATVAINTMMSERADWRKARKKVIAYERNGYVGGNFVYKHFYLNSPERVGSPSTNHMPNGVFQISDFAPGEPQVYAHDMGSIIALNLRAAGIRVALNHEVTNFKVTDSGRAELTLQKTNNKKTTKVQSRLVGAAPGLGIPKLDHFEPKSRLYLRVVLGRGKEPTLQEFMASGIVTSHRLLKAFYEEPAAVERALENRDIIIVGREHSAFITAEAMMGGLIHPEEAQEHGFSAYHPYSGQREYRVRNLTATANTVYTFGLRSHTTQEMYRELKPGGGIEHNPLFPMRYNRFGLIYNVHKLNAIGSPAVRITRLSRSRHRVEAEDGQRRDGDLVILATGHTNTSLQALNLEHANLVNIDADIDGRPSQVAQQAFVDGKPLPLILFGAGMRIDIDGARLRRTLTGSPHSFNYLSPGSAAVGKLFARHMGADASSPVDMTAQSQVMDINLPIPPMVSGFINVRLFVEDLIRAGFENEETIDERLQKSQIGLGFYYDPSQVKFFQNYIIERFREQSTTSEDRIRILDLLSRLYFLSDGVRSLVQQIYVFYASRFENPEQLSRWRAQERSYPSIVTQDESRLILNMYRGEGVP
jgi:hypothetical protein